MQRGLRGAGRALRLPRFSPRQATILISGYFFRRSALGPDPGGYR